jgi:hypothetical protein
MSGKCEENPVLRRACLGLLPLADRPLRRVATEIAREPSLQEQVLLSAHLFALPWLLTVWGQPCATLV